jgi:hypothetical protein
MPSLGWDSPLRPRKPTKADYLMSRRFRQPLPKACRMYLERASTEAKKR